MMLKMKILTMVNGNISDDGNDDEFDVIVNDNSLLLVFVAPVLLFLDRLIKN